LHHQVLTSLIKFSNSRKAGCVPKKKVIGVRFLAIDQIMKLLTAEIEK
jgi:hypothetical protein